METQKTNSIYTYIKEWDCPLCGRKFPVLRFRQSRLKAVQRDGDHHVWYADDQHPVRFYVVVCPGCGYAAGENHFAAFEPKRLESLRGRTGGLALSETINLEREDNERVASIFGHAIRLALAAKVPASHMAGLYLRAAWFCREIGDPEQEKIFLQLAYNNYETAYKEEPLPIGPMTRLGITYLLGELARRLEDYQRSSYWFGQAALLKEDLKAEPALARLLAEQHQVMREEYRAKNSKENAGTGGQ